MGSRSTERSAICLDRWRPDCDCSGNAERMSLSKLLVVCSVELVSGHASWLSDWSASGQQISSEGDFKQEGLILAPPQLRRGSHYVSLCNSKRARSRVRSRPWSLTFARSSEEASEIRAPSSSTSFALLDPMLRCAASEHSARPPPKPRTLATALAAGCKRLNFALLP